MLKELTVDEMKEMAKKVDLYSDANLLLKEAADAISRGEKVKIKEKRTKTVHSLVVYRYDKDLYRYSICGEIFLKN